LKPLSTPRRRRQSGPAAFTLFALLALLTFTGGCKTSVREDPILRLSSAESLAEGKRLYDLEKYDRARPYLSHAFEVEPNSAGGREALLLVADCYYKAGSDADLIQAEAKYRDFQNRFPTSPKAAYVQFQIAMSLAGRIERPERDQLPTHKARAALEDLLRLFPTSEYAPTAREELVTVLDRLAEHEYVIGRFYLRYGSPGAAANRLEGLLKNYPDYSQKDKALFYLAQTFEKLARPDDAQATWTRLRTDYPESPWTAKIPTEKRS
jgi:outer membrane protein assembly factor BamD